jgi:hypothetical protein
MKRTLGPDSDSRGYEAQLMVIMAEVASGEGKVREFFFLCEKPVKF